MIKEFGASSSHLGENDDADPLGGTSLSGDAPDFGLGPGDAGAGGISVPDAGEEQGEIDQYSDQNDG